MFYPIKKKRIKPVPIISNSDNYKLNAPVNFLSTNSSQNTQDMK